MDLRLAFICLVGLGIWLLCFGPEIYTWFDHTEWKTCSNPNINATIVDISSEKVQHIKNGAKFKTTVTFSDGFQFITHKTNTTAKLLTYTISVDANLRNKIIEKAVLAHNDALNNPSKAVKRYMEEGQKMEQERLAQAQIEIREALEREKMRQQELQRKEEARKKLQQNQDEAGRLADFLAEAETYERIQDVSSLWESARMEDNALTSAITQAIEKAARIERMYAVDPHNVQKLVADIRKLIEGEVQ